MRIDREGGGCEEEDESERKADGWALLKKQTSSRARARSKYDLELAIQRST